MEVLFAPFATRGRLAFSCLLAFVLLSIWGIGHLIGSHQPAESRSGGLVLEPDAGKLRPVLPGPAEPSADVTMPEEIRSHKEEVARQRLAEIGDGLRRYAKVYGSFPPELSPDLRELAPFGDYARLLEGFAGGRLGAYTRTLSPDFRQDRVVLEATPKGLDQPVRHELTYLRPPVFGER
jgi:hypothetical protein